MFTPGTAPPQAKRIRIVVATTVMLTFISWWRAAAIVLNDLGSSAFYAGGIAEQAIGKAAPWFIIGVMLFSFAVRAVYVESCSMFVRGGVYRVVKEALGGNLAKISVSALMFDYILTGPISGVSAGQYIAGLINDTLATADLHGWVPRAVHTIFHGTPQVNANFIAVVLAVATTLYYWRQNIKGIEESSEKALRVMEVTTVMVVLLLVWSGITLAVRGIHLPPAPIPSSLHFNAESLGFLKGFGNIARLFGIFGIVMAFGHSILAMSGEETLAQVYREIAHPKLRNLKRTALVIAVYSFVFTGICSLLAVMLIPDQPRMTLYKDNLIAGMAMSMVGPQILRLVFRAFVVVVGFLMLSGAINTSIVGSNGVLNRVSEDGVLMEGFRKPHPRFGTSYRMINLVVGLQLFTILVSRGDVYVLGEAYAFGVIWSFVFNSLSILVLRFKYTGPRGWKVPPNLTIGGVEVPIGLISVHLVLVATAIVNLFTKSVATVAGVVFTAMFFLVFTASERVNRRRFATTAEQMKEQFQLLREETVARETTNIRPGNVLVTVRDYNTLQHLRWVLQRADTKDQDVVVMEAHLVGVGAAEYELSMEQIFSEYEQTLFSRAVSLAESFGKKISLLVVPARDVWSAIVQTANALESSVVVAGLSSKMAPQEQSFYLGRAWEAMPDPKRQFLFQVVKPDFTVETYTIGPHTPSLKPEDVQLTHRLWLQITRLPGLEKLHHADVISLALTRLARDFTGREHDEVVRELKSGKDKRFGLPTPSTTARPGVPSPEKKEPPANSQNK
jgi:amino acid transporter